MARSLGQFGDRPLRKGVLFCRPGWLKWGVEVLWCCGLAGKGLAKSD
jgi:hypothetical protein